MDSSLEEKSFLLSLNPSSSWLIKLITFQADFLTNILIFLFSPFTYLAYEFINRTEQAEKKVEDTVVAATQVPYKVAEGGIVFLKKLGYGCLGAFYACMILTAILILALVVGVGLVQFWIEEPVFYQEPIHFDYTQVHPTAVFSFQGKKKKGVPAGQTYYVSLVLLMPESDFNRYIGVFQVTAEAIAVTGNTLAISSQPCMLRYRSLPVRLMHTFIMGVPLLLGISGETQTIGITILKHKEGYPRTRAIRLTLQPRAGTSGLPQLYSTEIVIRSELPLIKQVVRNWKWTLYVWTSSYVYIIFLVLTICCCRPLFFPVNVVVRNQRDFSVEDVQDQTTKVRGDREALESLERWCRSRISSRSKRKAPFGYDFYQETVGSSASSSAAVSREEASEVVEDFGGFTDAESVCQGA
ncbi:hypothetical protein AQUCO_00300537v1 [Aquilegia coerulea]|uniref:Seipin n=1 Tax=Aquilegia coerulea TaxID=218851 RepID=A0A2G5EZC8_AQUCA|nr:hypothetical protein AQUCO_00300537v1 [Aquilegia coerulea]